MKESPLMLSDYLFQRARLLRSQKKTYSEIARELNLHRQTVKRYLNSNTPPGYSRRTKSTREDPAESFSGRIEYLMKHPTKLSRVEIFEILRQEGYRGSERTIQRRCALLQQKKPKERFFEQEYEPGEQAQFDFKESVDLPFEDGVRTVNLHFGTLPCSDTCFVRGYPFLTFECFIDGIHHFFEKIGGLTRNIRIDNLSPCVWKVLKGSKRLYTAAFQRAIDYYGFTVLPCSPGKGNEKGDVERDIQTFARRIKNLVEFQGIRFRNWEHLNDWLFLYMLNSQKEDQKEKWIQEKSHLLPLPPADESILCRIETGPASRLGTVNINNSTYSVPDFAIGSGCRTVMAAYDVRVYLINSSSKSECIAIHPRMEEGSHSVLLEHVLPSLLRKPQAIVRWAHRDLLFPHQTMRKFYSYLKTIPELNAEREFLRAANLVLHLPLSEIVAGMDLVMESKTKAPFEDLKNILMVERRPNPNIPLHQNKLTVELTQYDNLIPKTGGM